MSILKFFRRDYWQRRHVSAWADETALLIHPDAETPTATMPAPVPAYRPAPAYTPEIREAAAAIVARAEADALAAQASAETQQWGGWDDPGTPLAATPGPVQPPRRRPPAPAGDLSAIMVAQIPPPDPDITAYGKAHDYADYMRRIAVATGTSTDAEETGFWHPAALAPAAPGAEPGFHGEKVPAPAGPGGAS